MLVQLANRQVLEHAILDLVEPVVILIQHLAGARDAYLGLGRSVPGHRREPVEIGFDDPVLRGGGRQLRQPVEFAAGFLLGLLRHAGGVDLLPQLLDLGLGLAAFAQLLLDRLELLPEEVLSLRLAQLLLHIGLDFLAQLEDVEFLGEKRVQRLELVLEGVDFEQFLPFGRLHPQVRCYEVHQPAGVVVNIERCGDQFIRQMWHECHETLEQVDRVAAECLNLDRVFDFLRVSLDPGDQIRLFLDNLQDTHPIDALHGESHRTIRHAHHLVNAGDRPNLEDVIRSSALGEFGILLHH